MNQVYQPLSMPLSELVVVVELQERILLYLVID
jgi:hypothetical protein